MDALLHAEGLAGPGPAHIHVHWEGGAEYEVEDLDGRGQGRRGELTVDLKLAGRQHGQAVGEQQVGLGAFVRLGDGDGGRRRLRSALSRS